MFNGKYSNSSFGRNGSAGGKTPPKTHSGELNSANKPASNGAPPPIKPKAKE